MLHGQNRVENVHYWFRKYMYGRPLILGGSRVGHMAHQFMHVKGSWPAKNNTQNASKFAFLRQGRQLRGDEGDMSPQYSDRGDDMLYVPPPAKKNNSLVSACHSVA